MWHQLWSCSLVSRTSSTMAAPGERSLTVTSAVRAPAPRQRASASLVAHVPPSCENPITKPWLCGPRKRSNAWLDRVRCPCSPPRAFPIRLAAAMAACSLVPQPVVVIGRLSPAAPLIHSTSRATAWSRAARSTRRPASAGSAAIILVIRYGGPARPVGADDATHGSGAPGSGASGSKFAAQARGVAIPAPPASGCGSRARGPPRWRARSRRPRVE